MKTLATKKKPTPVTDAELIADLKAVADCTEVVTRDFYREHGQFSDKQVSTKFATFEEFCKAAGVNQPAETSEIEGDKWSVFIPSTEFCSAADVIEYCKVDTKVWELDRFRAKDVSKEDSPRFQISAFFKKRKDILAIQAEIDSLKAIAAGNSIAPSLSYKHKASENLLEISIPDAHFGKLCWGEETGYEPYDIKIASAMYMRAVRTLLERVKGTTYAQVLYIVGNDMMNADNLEGQTTSGTQVTNDARYHKVFDVTRTTTIWAIEELRKIAPVKVLVLGGNHDRLSAWHLGDSVQCYFHTYEDVIVDNQPRQRKYHEFGVCMLGFTHGDRGDKADYPLLMATEQPAMFGRTQFREMHCGHTHETKTQEKHGIRVRVLPALTPADDWHSEHNFVGNLRNAEAYTWSKTEGLTGITIFNDQSQPCITSQVVLE